MLSNSKAARPPLVTVKSVNSWDVPSTSSDERSSLVLNWSRMTTANAVSLPVFWKRTV